ncbi:MAG: plasmid replication initiator TrfA, partial [Mariprofundaceae bacterium]|nr:plasmid replication initiator TrfA [Mariprofundaceae bacterium]
ADIIRFPNCPPEHQAAPSSLLRSALFGIVKRGKRAYLENVDIASWENVKITYTGARLMQSDQDVWLACVEACARQKSTNIVISQRSFMQIAGRKGGDTKRIWSDLVRLRAATIVIEDEYRGYAGGLINDVEKNDKTGHLEITINPKMIGLFGGNVTHIDTTMRHALKMDLAKWLQGYVCSHKATWRKPHFIGLEKLQALSGSEIAVIRKFRQQLKKAMDELQASDVVAGWKLENDILTIWRPKS